MDKFDEIYLWDLNTSTYMAFKEFYSYKRDIGININDFMVCSEFLYQKLQNFGMALPNGVPAFFRAKCSELVWRKGKINKDHVCESQL